MESDKYEKARQALDIWRSLDEDSVEVRWASVELAWSLGLQNDASVKLSSLLERGLFVSALQPIQWAERLLEAGQVELSELSLGWAERYVPEEPLLWHLLGVIAREKGRDEDAKRYWERALTLDPQHVPSFLGLLGISKDGITETSRLTIEGPKRIDLGREAEVICRLSMSEPDWSLYVLPPAGWGIVPVKRRVNFGPDQTAVVRLEGRRPDRVRGGAWPVVFLAVGPEECVAAKCDFRVPDTNPGQVLVTVTEDHEIHEERGSLSRETLRRLLVDKSRFAATRDEPWTHMVETGSVLAMPEWSATESGAGWRELETAIRSHLSEEVSRGNDVQPHLHAFNDPRSPDFPYRLAGDAWRPSLKFLMTTDTQRGTWASACRPPELFFSEMDRVQSVARSVSRLESVARLGDPDYRAVLWRSGLLEYGKSSNDRTWSAVALKRAGLLAVSDMAKPTRPWQSEVGPAFPVGWLDPFEFSPGGPMYQLPIAANLEGDYLMGARALARRARKSVRRVAGKPGVHLFTLLTHDKFINARRGGDEFRLDPEYGEWVTIRRHMDVWKEAGAEFVTARQGVKALVEDLSWNLTAWLEQETFLDDSNRYGVRYRVNLLGRGIQPSEDFPHHVLVTVPPWLRGRFNEVLVNHGGTEVEPDMRAGTETFWIRVTKRDGLTCTFWMSEPVGPSIRSVEEHEPGVWRVLIDSTETFLNARVLVHCETLPSGDWEVRDGDGRLVSCRVEEDGLLLPELRFERRAAGEISPLEIWLTCAGQHVVEACVEDRRE
jgi:hypothetical protein